MTAVEALVCGGRELDRHLRSVGNPCRRTYRSRGRDLIPAALHAQARAAGWLIIPLDDTVAVTCPRCRRPDRNLVQDCAELAASISPPNRVETPPTEDGDR